MKIPICLVFLCSLSLGAAQERRGPEDREGERGKGPRERGADHAERFFKHFDENKDGQVTRAEFDAGKRIKNLEQKVRDKLFQRLDKNADGVIERQEMRRMKGKEPFVRGIHRFLREADADQNQKITFEEFSAHPRFAKIPEKRRRKMFNRMDRNKDGVIDSDDRPPRPPRAERPSRDRFKALDLDQNGSLSWAEFQNLPHAMEMTPKKRRQHFRKLDSNGDEEISPEEMRKAGPPPHHRGKQKPKERPKK